ncbi:MAG: 50S ribosomal protein L22 [Acidobacteriota bacterium]
MPTIKNMEAIAKIKHLKGSPRKARLVIDLIRGQNVSRALSILKFTDKRAALPISKCLNSAIANATFLAEQQNIAIDPDDLWVNLCFIDMGAHKHRSRMRPAPQGRAYREQRHYCHITIQVTSADKPKSEKQLKIEASLASRPVGKKLAAKAEAKAASKDTVKKALAEKAETKKAKAEEVEAATANAQDDLITSPVQPTAQDIVGASDSAAAEPAIVDQTASDTSEIADAKNISTQTTEALNETKPADEKMLDNNEELERQ